jgi:predicted nucleotidyltransferase
VSDSALLDTVSRLFGLLEERGIDYLLVGGIALLQYVEGRNTEDIDLIMALSSLDRLPEVRKVGQEKDFARGDFEGLQIDLLLTSNPLFEMARHRYATRQRFSEREIPCATPEGLVLLKLYALPSLYRQGNLARVALYETDILMLMDRHKVDVEPLFAELTPHLSATDLASLRGITDEIRRRIERFGGQFR